MDCFSSSDIDIASGVQEFISLCEAGTFGTVTGVASVPAAATTGSAAATTSGAASPSSTAKGSSSASATAHPSSSSTAATQQKSGASFNVAGIAFMTVVLALGGALVAL
jgi:hypothetical protein